MHTRVIYDRVQNKKINFEIPAIFERRGFQINFPVPYPIMYNPNYIIVNKLILIYVYLTCVSANTCDMSKWQATLTRSPKSNQFFKRCGQLVSNLGLRTQDRQSICPNSQCSIWPETSSNVGTKKRFESVFSWNGFLFNVRSILAFLTQ